MKGFEPSNLTNMNPYFYKFLTQTLTQNRKASGGHYGHKRPKQHGQTNKRS